MCRSRHASLRSAWVIVGLLPPLAVLHVAGCAKSAPSMRAEMAAPSPDSMAAPSAPLPADAPGGPGAGDEAAGSAASRVPGAEAVLQAAQGRHLIRTANISVEVQDAQHAVEQLERVASSLGGFVSDTSVTRAGDGSQSGSISLRIPSDRFDKALQQVREIGRVESWTTNVQDVTAAYVDLEARIRNAKREELEVTKLYDRGGKLEDVLKVSARLAEVRGVIEQLEGQMRVMKDQVSLSTVAVSFYERGQAAVAETTEYDLAYHLRGAVRSLAVIARAILTTVIYVVISGSVLWVPLVAIILVARSRRRARAAKVEPPTGRDRDVSSAGETERENAATADEPEA